MALIETIAILCQVSVCNATVKPEEIQAEQAKCQSYFVQCMEQGRKTSKYKYDDRFNLEVCIAARPAQILTDKTDAKIREINRNAKVPDRTAAGVSHGAQ